MVDMTPAPIATRPAAPNAMPIINDRNNEFIRLNSGYLPDNCRQIGTLAAIMSSRAHEVTASTNIIEKSIWL